MKRRQIIRKLKKAGYTIRKGKKHDKIFDQDDHFRSVLSRQSEIDDLIVEEIEDQTGVNLL